MPRMKRAEGAVPLTPAEEAADVAATEADSLFAQLMAANKAPEPGTTSGRIVGKTIDDEGGRYAVPMVAAQVESAGYTYVYDQATGDRSTVNNNMLKQALAKLHPDTGKIMFALRPPTRVTDGVRQVVVPFAGTHKCRLHPDDPERPLWDEMGFVVCTKDNLRTRHARDMHLRNRHKDEYKAIKEREAEIERDEAKLERRALLSVVTAGRVGLDAPSVA